jgi:hypothetical protein
VKAKKIKTGEVIITHFEEWEVKSNSSFNMSGHPFRRITFIGHNEILVCHEDREIPTKQVEVEAT